MIITQLGGIEGASTEDAIKKAIRRSLKTTQETVSANPSNTGSL